MSLIVPSVLSLTRFPAHIGLADWLARGVVAVRAIGPYAAIEILLPGGTLLAFSSGYTVGANAASLCGLSSRDVCPKCAQRGLP